MTANVVRQQIIFPLLFLLLLDPRSGLEKNQDPGKTSRIRNTGLFGLHVHSCTHWQRHRHPPAFGLIYEGAIGQPR